MTADRIKRQNSFLPKQADCSSSIQFFWYRYCAQVDTTVLLLKKKIKIKNPQYNNLTEPMPPYVWYGEKDP